MSNIVISVIALVLCDLFVLSFCAFMITSIWLYEENTEDAKPFFIQGCIEIIIFLIAFMLFYFFGE